MKKDKAWIKDEVKSLFDKAYDLGKMEYHESEESTHRINSLIDQLEEPETLSEEWINEHSKSYTMENAVEISDLKNLLLPQPKKPIIPQFVADFYENHKSDWAKTLTVVNYNMCEYDRIGELNEFENWYVNTEKALLILSDMRYGYEVEKEKEHYDYNNRDGCEVQKEKKYYVFDNRDDSYLGFNGERTKLEWHYHTVNKESFTEAEIKAIDERYWEFAQEVTE